MSRSLISRNQSLLGDILHAAKRYKRMSCFTRFLKASKTKKTLLRLNNELRFFIDQCLVRGLNVGSPVADYGLQVLSAVHGRTVAFNIEALAGLTAYVPSTAPSTTNDNVEWDVMSHCSNHFKVGTNSRPAVDVAPEYVASAIFSECQLYSYVQTAELIV